jgi:hypothetical protein
MDLLSSVRNLIVLKKPYVLRFAMRKGNRADGGLLLTSKVSTREYKEYARDLYLTPNIQAEPAYHVKEIIRLLEIKFPELTGNISEDTIFAWADESKNGELTWSDLRAISQTLRITNEGQPPGKPWVEVIIDEHRSMQNVGNGAAMTLKMQAIGWLASHYSKEENEFTSPAEAIMAFTAANSLLKENEKIKLPAR